MDETRFARRLLGYSASQVRACLRAQKARNEALLMEKQERLLALRDENLALRERLGDIERQQADIAGALMEAKAQSRRMLEQARERIREERERAQKDLEAIEERIAARREALRTAARNMDLLAAEFARAAAQQDRILSLPADGQRGRGA
ncbi:MAG: hypothetical protein ACOX7W_04115 [Christensenellales bacterium]|jgi:chromosome segregation ATPase